MKGLMGVKYPITMTTNYLKEGIELRDSIKCVTIHYSEYEAEKEEMNKLHQSTRKFVELNFNQLQYKNPDVQILVIKNIFPSPFFSFFMADGQKFHIDAHGKSHIELLRHVQKVAGKPAELIEMENQAIEPNMANFGKGYQRASMLGIDGQFPHSANYVDMFSMEARKKLQGKYHDINKRWTDSEDAEPY